MSESSIRCDGYIRRAADRRRTWEDSIPVRLDKDFHVPFESVTYNQDGLISIHSTAFAHDPRFGRAYAKAKATGSWTGSWGQVDIHWRAHILCWAGLQASHLPGDFVECGVNRGGTAMLLLDYLNWINYPKKCFYLYDTFEGLDPRLSTAEELSKTQGVYESCFDEVRALFSPWSNVIPVKGSIPESLRIHTPKKVAYLHIDLNAAKPEQAALEFFWDRLLPGAWIVFDDYAWVACAQQKLAIDSVARSHGCEVVSLPTGQGLLLKPQ